MSFSSAIKKFSSLKKPGRVKDLTQGFQVPGNRHNRSEIEKAPQAGLSDSPPVGDALNFNFLYLLWQLGDWVREKSHLIQ
jgi:hypothetical protein